MPPTSSPVWKADLNTEPTQVAQLLWQLVDLLRADQQQQADANIQHSATGKKQELITGRKRMTAYREIIKMIDLCAAKVSMIETKVGPLGFFDLAPAQVIAAGPNAPKPRLAPPEK